jgi:hypothetical protein
MRNLITLLYIFLLPALLVGQGNQTAGALKEQPINRGLEATIDKLFGATNNPTSPGCPLRCIKMAR